MSAALAGRTVAVFAGGLNHIGPKSNQNLFEQIESHSGALISELCPGTVPEARRICLLRNRLIAALSSTLIVAQARARCRRAQHRRLGERTQPQSVRRAGETSPCRITPAAIAYPRRAEPPSSAHWRRSTNYAIARIARNMSTCRRHRTSAGMTDESDDAILATIKTCAEANGHVPQTICSI